MGLQRLEQERYHSGAYYSVEIDDAPLVLDLSILLNDNYSQLDDTLTDEDGTVVLNNEEQAEEAPVTYNYLLD